jgi:AbrB family looped-hinge helix DNA binding protein
MVAQMATVTAKGQITIPKSIREALGITTQDRVLFVMEGDRVILVPLHRHPLSHLYGALPATRSYPGHQAIREEVQKGLGETFARGEE